MPLDWFTARIGSYVMRSIPNDGTRSVLIVDQRHAEYLFNNQDNEHTYA